MWSATRRFSGWLVVTNLAAWLLPLSWSDLTIPALCSAGLRTPLPDSFSLALVFNSPMQLAWGWLLMLAAELARGLKLNAPFLKQTLKHWRAAQKKLPREADHTEIYKYQKKLTRG